MSDQFTTVTNVGYGSRIVNSFKNILFGIILFLISFGVLYWNEGRYDLSQLAKKSIQVNASSVDQSLNGNIVAVSGEIMGSDMVGDTYVAPGNYLVLKRNVETFAWVEKKQTKSKDNLGGSQTNTTTYTYEKQWTTNPRPSSDFAQPEGHENPPQSSIRGSEVRASSASIGTYTIDMQNITVPTLPSLAVNPDMVVTDPNVTVSNGNIFLSTTGGSPDMPNLGDVKISYSALASGIPVTVLGKQNGSSISSYYDDKGHKLFHLFTGTREDGIAQLHSSYTMWMWIWRGAGFLMMWLGLQLLFGWITTLAKVVPFLARLTGSVIGIITFIAALTLSIVTIVVSMIFHNVIAVVISVVVVAGILFYFLKKKNTSTEPPMAV